MYRQGTIYILVIGIFFLFSGISYGTTTEELLDQTIAAATEGDEGDDTSQVIFEELAEARAGYADIYYEPEIGPDNSEYSQDLLNSSSYTADDYAHQAIEAFKEDSRYSRSYHKPNPNRFKNGTFENLWEDFYTNLNY